MKNKKHILSVRIEHVADQDGDSSCLGKFTDTLEDGAIVRTGQHRGKLAATLEADELPERGREYRYFVPAMSGEETGNPESPQQDWKRMEDLSNGQWCYIGIVAKAVVRSEAGISQTLRSGGRWGIESDSDARYFAEVEAEQLSELRAEMESFGFGPRAIGHAFKAVSGRTFKQ